MDAGADGSIWFIGLGLLALVVAAGTVLAMARRAGRTGEPPSEAP